MRHGLGDSIEKSISLCYVFSALERIALRLCAQPQFVEGEPARIGRDDASGLAVAAGHNLVDPAPGSTVKASLLESPRFSSTAVVDGAIALASIVPAEAAPDGLTSHIW